MRLKEGFSSSRPAREGPAVRRFPSPGVRAARGRSAIGAIIALVALLGSMAAMSLGPAIGDALPYPVLVLLMLIRG